MRPRDGVGVGGGAAWSAVFAIALATPNAVASPAHLDDPALYRFEPAIDLPILVGAYTLWATAYVVASPELRNNLCDPCAPDRVNALDRPFVDVHIPEMRAVAHGSYVLPAIAFALFDIADVGLRRWPVWMADLVVVMESMAVQGAVTEVFRRAVRRPRPFLYVPGLYPDDRGGVEATYSFYSGHASSMFDLMTAIAYTWTQRHPGSGWRAVGVWTGLYLAAAVMPVARVLSGDHFPTDVLVGATVGVSFGLLWPALRRITPRTPGGTALSLLPGVHPEGLTFSVAGHF
jgi:membrane-associated phospholipid phosphatase